MRNTNYKIRRLNEQDLDEVLKIEKQCFNKESKNDFLNCISRSEVYSYFVCEVENQIVGYYGIMHISEDGELLTIAVKKQEQGKGYGKVMMESAILQSSLKNSTKLFLEVNEHNTPAISLYKKMGFDTISKRANYYGNDAAIIMQKEL